MKKGKEEAERIERIIRGLIKLPENRRCINCNSLGPQYVCTTFWTFVCTNCSGVHREFTHRVKSVSMAKFNDEEVSCLQAGGNERVRQIYFKEWDPNRNSYPDGSNLHRLRDFIKHVYVDRRYSGQATNATLPRLRLSDKEESLESRKVALYRGGFRNPSYEDRNERSERFGPVGRSNDKSFRYYYEERRSPRYAQENSPHGGPRRTPVRLEIVDDRFRDDDTQRGRLSDSHSHRHSLRGGSKFGNVSPEPQHNRTQSSSPVMHSVRDLLGESAPRLQVGEHSKATSGKDAEGSAHNQIASSGNVASSGGNPVQEKSQPSQSLIDLDNDSQPSDAASQPQTQENHPSSSGGNHSSHAASQPQTQENHPSSSGGNHSSHESSAQKTAPAPNPNSLEFLLFELAPSNVPANNASEVPSNSIPPPTASGGNMLMSTNVSTDGAGTVPAPPAGGTLSLLDFNAPATPAPTSGGPPQIAPGVGDNSNAKVSNIQQVSSQQYQPAAIPATGGNSNGQQNIMNNEMWNAPNVPNAQGTSAAIVEHSSQNALKPAQDSNSGVASQQFGGRMELPADFFTTRYTQAPGPFVGWQAVQHYGMGYGMQHHHPMSVPAYRNPTTPANPFDLSSETTSFHEPPFPSMGNFRGALPPMSAPGALSRASSFGNNSSGLMAANLGVLTRTPSFGNNSSGLMAANSGVLTRTPSFGNNAPGLIETGSPYSSARHPLPHPFAANTPGTYMGQEHRNMSRYSRPQWPDRFGSDGLPYGAMYMNQQPNNGYSPTSQNTFPSNRGNPFG